MSNIDPIEFGRVLGTLEAIERDMRDIRTNLVDRVAGLEKRIERCETRPSAEKPTFREQAVDKGLNMAMVSILAVIAKLMGAF